MGNLEHAGFETSMAGFRTGGLLQLAEMLHARTCLEILVNCSMCLALVMNVAYLCYLL